MMTGQATSTNQVGISGVHPADLPDELPNHIPQAIAKDPSTARLWHEVRQLQVEQTVHALPLLVLFHASAGFCLRQLVASVLPEQLLQLLQIAAVLVGIGFGAIFFGWRQGHWRNKAETLLQLLALLSLVLGLVWAVPAGFAAQFQNPSEAFPVLGLCVCMIGIGALSLLRVPAGAIVFIALVSAAMARSLYLNLDEGRELGALVAVTYGLALAAIVYVNQRDFLRRTAVEIENEKQRQVIKLLLNDFERDASDWLWECDTNARLTYCSPRFAEVLGRPNDTLSGLELRELFAGRIDAATWEKLSIKLSQDGSFEPMSFDIIVQDRMRHWQFVAHALHDVAGAFAGYRGVGRDVTEQHEARRRIESEKDASERANVAKSEFLAVVSHELRTPINAIVGFSELLAREDLGSQSPAVRHEYSQAVLDSAKHLQTLISDLLDATRLERGTMRINEQENDALELAEIAVTSCRAAAEQAEVQVVAKLTGRIVLMGDVNRLKQVMVNLIQNAIKFSPKGGIVNVEMQRGRDGQFVLAVRDAGIGIPASELESVFDPFKQVEGGLTRRFGGLGLGLFTARRIARMHDGDVRLNSVEGSGTTAMLILPASRVVWPSGALPEKQQVA